MRERHQSPVSKSSISDCLSSMSGTPPPARCLETVIIIFTTEDRFLVLNKKKTAIFVIFYIPRYQYMKKEIIKINIVNKEKNIVQSRLEKLGAVFWQDIKDILTTVHWELSASFFSYLQNKLKAYSYSEIQFIIINNYISKCNYP